MLSSSAAAHEGSGEGCAADFAEDSLRGLLPWTYCKVGRAISQALLPHSREVAVCAHQHLAVDLPGLPGFCVADINTVTGLLIALKPAQESRQASNFMQQCCRLNLPYSMLKTSTHHNQADGGRVDTQCTLVCSILNGIAQCRGQSQQARSPAVKGDHAFRKQPVEGLLDLIPAHECGRDAVLPLGLLYVILILSDEVACTG